MPHQLEIEKQVIKIKTTTNCGKLSWRDRLKCSSYVLFNLNLDHEHARVFEKVHGALRVTMDGRRDGWMDGWMNGWFDGWMDGWMDG